MLINLYRICSDEQHEVVVCHLKPVLLAFGVWDTGFDGATLYGEEVELSEGELQLVRETALARIDEDLRYLRQLKTHLG